MLGVVFAILCITFAIGIPVGILWFFVNLFTKRAKKIPVIIIVCSIACSILFVIIGIAVTPVEEDTVSKKKYDELNTDYENIVLQNEALSGENESLGLELSKISDEYTQYKESMGEYEGLAKSEAESRLIEAESIAEAHRMQEESIAAAEEESRSAKEKAGYETGITYEQLARTPNDYFNEKVKFTGKVVQLIEGTNFNQIRFAVDSDYDEILYCSYDKNKVKLESRILEDDVITIYGISKGLYTYKSTMGASITIPSASIEKIDMDESGSAASPEELKDLVSIDHEWTYVPVGGYTYYILEATNGSDSTIEIDTNVIAKDADGKTVGVDSEREDAVAPGATVVIVHSFNVDNAASFEPTLTCKKDKYYESITQDLTYEVSDTGKGLVVTCTNVGTEAMSWVIGTVLFFNGDECTDYNYDHFTDSDSELKPGATIAKQFNYYEQVPYDSYEVYFSGRR